MIPISGTHLPDITLITPVFIDEEINLKSSNAKSLPKASHSPFAYVACRAHHADVGGISPGSMPIAREIYQEGLIIPPIKLISEGKMNNDVLELILSNVRTPDEHSGDLYAQVGANQRGHFLINELIQRYGKNEVTYIDFRDVKSAAHLPYEMLVSGNKVYALYARFRIATSFPDLSMMGENSFMRIRKSPEAIRKALVTTAGGKL